MCLCSGLGTIRRKPEIRYKDLDSIKSLPDLQLEILKTSAGYLKKGGRLLLFHLRAKFKGKMKRWLPRFFK
ncbi:MAG: hypothetical protein L6V88_03785 [Anaerotruncus sp.]|nr:MAG: hypothetical protein L6V88_03785 [Anaerotruncus sp.]